MSLRAIRTALETRVSALSPPLPTGWENVEFEPDETRVNQLVYLLPAATQSPTFGGPELTHESGILQITLMTPVNLGTGELMDRADVVRDHFPKGLSMTSGGITVTIQRRASVTPAREDNGWYRIDLSIPYFANVYHAT